MISVLYVDDEPGLLDIGKLFLEQGGQFVVDTITSATEALTLLNTKKYDAIISDYQMPEMNGIDFLKRVRTSGNTVPFILFTGRGREEVVIQALNEGADFYLQKGGEPVSQFTELAHKIRQAVQKRRAEMSVRDHEQREADIISFLPDATVAIDTHGVVIAWNKAAEKLTGVRASEILGKSDHEYTLPFYHERRPALIDLVLHDDPDLEAKYPLLKRNGRTLIAEATIPFLYNGRGATIWFTATPLFNTQGTIIGAIESVRDITDRKQAEMELGRKHEELEAAYNQLSAQENELKQRMNDIIASQSALRKSEEKYRDLIENAGEIIFIVQGEYLKFVNQRATEVTGYSREELLSRPFLEFVHPDDRAMITANYPHWLRGELLGVYTFRIVRGNGEVRNVEIRAVPIIWDGSPATLNFIMDITRQKQAEIALRESEEKYRNVVEDQTEFISRFLPDGTHVFVNEAYCRYFGLKRDEILGLRFRPRIPDEERERLNRFFESLTPEHPVDNITHRVIMQDGSMRWQSWSDRAIFDPSGTIVEYQAVGRDITEQKRAENEIAFKNILLLTQQETSLDGILIVDENAKIINYNKKFLEIWRIPEDLLVSRIDEPVLQFVTGQLVDPEMFLARVRYLYDHKDEKSYEKLLLKDGRILERFSAPLLGERGNYYGKVWYFRDITDRKRAEKALEQARKKLSLLNYVTFNDIQNMIFSLSAYMQLAKNPVTNMPIGNIIEKEKDILQKITHSLNFAKSYQDLGLKPPRWQNVNHVFLYAISHLDFLSMKHIVMLDGLEIFADPLLEQVFQILADNTLIHGKTATQVVVRYAEGPESLTLIFEDDGVGIPEDAKEKIFSPDFQNIRAVGLFLAREILEITGITIMETGEPGKGVKFEMTVPKGTYRFSAQETASLERKLE